MTKEQFANILRAACDLGAAHGKDAASWAFGNNTTEERYQEVLNGIEDQDPAVLDTLPYPPTPTDEQLLTCLGLDSLRNLPKALVVKCRKEYLTALNEEFWLAVEAEARVHVQGQGKPEESEDNPPLKQWEVLGILDAAKKTARLSRDPAMSQDYFRGRTEAAKDIAEIYAGRSIRKRLAAKRARREARGNPPRAAHASSLPLTLGEAKLLRYGEELHDRVNRYADGTCVRWRVAGKVQTWKTDPTRVRVPLRHGLYNYEAITERNYSFFHRSAECRRQRERAPNLVAVPNPPQVEERLTAGAQGRGRILLGFKLTRLVTEKESFDARSPQGMGKVYGLSDGSLYIQGFFPQAPKGRLTEIWYLDAPKAGEDHPEGPNDTPWMHEVSSDVQCERVAGGLLVAKAGNDPLWSIR